MKLMKFGEMRYGQWFREGGKDRRTFIKIQNILPSGIQIIHKSVVARDHFYDNGEKMATKGEVTSYFNAIDQDGVLACCPDWVEFEIIKSPVKQRHKHNHGANLNLPRYPGDTMQGDDKRE